MHAHGVVEATTFVFENVTLGYLSTSIATVGSGDRLVNSSITVLRTNYYGFQFYGYLWNSSVMVLDSNVFDFTLSNSLNSSNFCFSNNTVQNLKIFGNWVSQSSLSVSTSVLGQVQFITSYVDSLVELVSNTIASDASTYGTNAVSLGWNYFIPGSGSRFVILANQLMCSGCGATIFFTSLTTDDVGHVFQFESNTFITDPGYEAIFFNYGEGNVFQYYPSNLILGGNFNVNCVGTAAALPTDGNVISFANPNFHNDLGSVTIILNFNGTITNTTIDFSNATFQGNIWLDVDGTWSDGEILGIGSNVNGTFDMELNYFSGRIEFDGVQTARALSVAGYLGMSTVIWTDTQGVATQFAEFAFNAECLSCIVTISNISNGAVSMEQDNGLIDSSRITITDCTLAWFSSSYVQWVRTVLDVTNNHFSPLGTNYNAAVSFYVADVSGGCVHRYIGNTFTQAAYMVENVIQYDTSSPVRDGSALQLADNEFIELNPNSGTGGFALQATINDGLLVFDETNIVQHWGFRIYFQANSSSGHVFRLQSAILVRIVTLFIDVPLSDSEFTFENCSFPDLGSWAGLHVQGTQAVVTNSLFSVTDLQEPPSSMDWTFNQTISSRITFSGTNSQVNGMLRFTFLTSLWESELSLTDLQCKDPNSAPCDIVVHLGYTGTIAHSTVFLDSLDIQTVEFQYSGLEGIVESNVTVTNNLLARLQFISVPIVDSLVVASDNTILGLPSSSALVSFVASPSLRSVHRWTNNVINATQTAAGAFLIDTNSPLNSTGFFFERNTMLSPALVNAATFTCTLGEEGFIQYLDTNIIQNGAFSLTFLPSTVPYEGYVNLVNSVLDNGVLVYFDYQGANIQNFYFGVNYCSLGSSSIIFDAQTSNFTNSWLQLSFVQGLPYVMISMLRFTDTLIDVGAGDYGNVNLDVAFCERSTAFFGTGFNSTAALRIYGMQQGGILPGLWSLCGLQMQSTTVGQSGAIIGIDFLQSSVQFNGSSFGTLGALTSLWVHTCTFDASIFSATDGSFFRGDGGVLFDYLTVSFPNSMAHTLIKFDDCDFVSTYMWTQQLYIPPIANDTYIHVSNCRFNASGATAIEVYLDDRGY